MKAYHKAIHQVLLPATLPELHPDPATVILPGQASQVQTALLRGIPRVRPTRPVRAADQAAAPATPIPVPTVQGQAIPAVGTTAIPIPIHILIPAPTAEDTPPEEVRPKEAHTVQAAPIQAAVHIRAHSQQANRTHLHSRQVTAVQPVQMTALPPEGV